MSWLWALLLGLVLGAVARAILPGRQNIPIWLTLVCGLIGAIVGNAVASWIGVDDTKGIDWIRHALQLAGAVAIVAIGAPLYAGTRGKSKARGR
ncbi:GlsB/YeaQ/YmgE family stress response membrane protein [Streptomyces boninensis]|uniref:GlsB/YeaQ/YmgE family stress response membrane protein n=1 Tax=Streptomyces boninensis TaxID=2039455 RepID=UPI003B214DB5